MDFTVKMPPGVVRGASPSDTPGTWYEANLVRWVNGVAQPVPGWEKILASVPASNIRAVHTWVSNSDVDYIGVLCEKHIYVYYDGVLNDVTPVGGFAGPADNLLVGGYGDDVYSYGTYGTARPDVEGANVIGPAWSLDNWGQNLLVMSSYDGRLLQWNPSTPLVKATAVTGAPVNNRCFVVTPQRHVLIFGLGGDFRRWGWCSQEDLNDWNFASTTNTAGNFYIEPAAPIVCAKSLKSGVLFFTTKKAYFASYLGVPYIYGYDEVGDNLTPISPGLLSAVSDRAVWWSDSGFWTYEAGSLSPLNCTLLDWVKKESDITYRRLRSFSMAIGAVSEVWFFFPSKDETENNKYVSHNYVTNEWSMGLLKRTCGVPSSFSNYPIMSNGQDLFFHEKGMFYGSNPLPYLESSSINLGSGGAVSTVSQVIPDHGPTDAVRYTWFGRMARVNPHTPGEYSKGPLQMRSDGYLDVRLTARDFRFRLGTFVNGSLSWTFGTMLVKISARGKR